MRAYMYFLGVIDWRICVYICLCVRVYACFLGRSCVYVCVLYVCMYACFVGRGYIHVCACFVGGCMRVRVFFYMYMRVFFIGARCYGICALTYVFHMLPCESIR